MKKEETIKKLILGSLSGKLTNSERHQLLLWLENRSENLIEYNRIKETWESKEIEKLKAIGSLDDSWRRFDAQIIQRIWKGKIRRLKYIKAAASVAILMGLGASLYFLLPKISSKQEIQITAELGKPYIISSTGIKHELSPEKKSIRYDEITQDSVLTTQDKKKAKRKPEINELIVPRGYRIKLELADGTMVWLNSESRLKYPVEFTEDTRRICLIGEGYFEVKHSETNPFIVETSDIEIEVLGTSFNVSAFPNDSHITTTLVDGSVKLHTTCKRNAITLLPNQSGIYSLSSHDIEVLNVDTEEHTSWINGYYTFNSESLDIVIKKLVRSYGIPISIADQELKKYKFSGKLELKQTLQEVLEVLKLVAPLEYYATDGKLTIQNKSE